MKRKNPNLLTLEIIQKLVEEWRSLDDSIKEVLSKTVL
jgi:hypothetical protein